MVVVNKEEVVVEDTAIVMDMDELGVLIMTRITIPILDKEKVQQEGMEEKNKDEGMITLK